MEIRSLAVSAKRTLVSLSAVAAVGVGVLVVPQSSLAVLVAKDPGVRGGAAGAGGPIPGLTANQLAFFDAGLDDFAEEEGVGDGLGPRFNMDSCGGCHAQPAVGGTSPAVNPQVAVATAGGAHNTVPSFITANGPVREARFVKNADGSPDGGVHALFVVSGRVDETGDASGCTIAQEDFATQVNNNNVIFRIPTPVFGMGLVEAIEDRTLIANINANNATKISLGIFGKFNVDGAPNNNGNDGTIARFGWKAQNKSGLLFAGEAYNVEMGISNELFNTEREENPNCQFATVPNDVQNTDATTALAATTAIQNFANFQRFSAPPTPVSSYTGANGSVSSTSIARGRQRFMDVGCHLCHTPTLQTSQFATVAALRNKPVNAFSDFAIHAMGPGLADGVAQGAARGDEFRTAPLWGLGQRIFFLHDGRTKDLRTAIDAHKSDGNSKFGPSEANAVIIKFDNLNGDDTQDLFNFLRSL
jgi:CxxC motif-containing protein (DUF1111 family)